MSASATSPTPAERAEIERRVAERTWYHSLELAPGVVTPGEFDLRPVVQKLPWPEVEGKRCLDVGTFDGQLAFELERRGAREVVAVDIDDVSDLDWPVATRESEPARIKAGGGTDPGAGFRLAKELLGSSVQRRAISVYDLSPGQLGTFDVVTCGSLLLHLRDPVRAAEAIRSVCSGIFMSNEAIDLRLWLISRRRPLAFLRGGLRCQWWIPNPAGHRRILEAAGFEVVKQTRPFGIPIAEGHHVWGRRPPARQIPTRLAKLLIMGNTGVPHSAAIARPREETGAGAERR